MASWLVWIGRGSRQGRGGLLMLGFALLALLSTNAPAAETTRTISELGFYDGFRFDGAGTVHARTFSFPTPRDTEVSAARLRLVYRASPLLSEAANLHIEVDGQSLLARTIDSGSEQQELSVVLPVQALRDGWADITVHASLPLSEERRADQLRTVSFMQILPETALVLEHARPASIRDAWLLLPSTVSVSLPPGKMSEQTFSTAWVVLDMLYREGHQVRFARLPELGDIVLGSREEMAEALTGSYPGDGQEGLQRTAADMPQEAQAIALVSRPEGQFIAISNSVEGASLSLLEGRWQPLAVASRYQRYTTNDSERAANPPSGGERYTLPLQPFGFDTRPTQIAERAQWEATISQRLLPPRTRPDSVKLKVIAPGHGGDEGYKLYVYFNERLLQVERLEPDGGSQEISVPLPAVYQQAVDRLRVVVLRHNGVVNDTASQATPIPMQISPESRLIVRPDDTQPKQFADLPRYLSAGFDAFVEERFLDAPETLLLLARLSADYPLPMDLERVRFVAAQSTLQPQSPFIAVGALKLEGMTTPVSFDKGVVKVVDKHDHSILELDATPQLAVVQLVHGGKKGPYGLWLRAVEGEALPNPGALNLSEGDVAFVDHSGVILMLNSEYPSLGRAYYPGVTDWLERLRIYRFWVVALAWLGLTLLMIYLYRKTRQHDRHEVFSEAGSDNHNGRL